MFKNVGGKIKGLAAFVTWLGIIASVVGGIFYMSLDFEDTFFLGLVIAVSGSIVAWISSFVLYGFGELVENSAIIAQKQDVKVPRAKTSNNDSVSQSQMARNPQKKGNGKCQMCGAENVEVSAVVIEDDLGTRYRNVCDACFEKYNCKPE